MNSSLVIKNQAWPLFILKSVLMFVCMYFVASTFFTRFEFVGDPQLVKCIPGYTVYLLDKTDTKLVRGKLYVFRSKDLSPIYDEGTLMLKYLKGMPGDTVEVRDTSQIFINDKPGIFGLSLAEEKLGLPASTFIGKSTLLDNQYWFLGTSTKSFDSRYWGSIKSERIVGRAYPIF